MRPRQLDDCAPVRTAQFDPPAGVQSADTVSTSLVASGGAAVNYVAANTPPTANKKVLVGGYFTLPGET